MMQCEKEDSRCQGAFMDETLQCFVPNCDSGARDMRIDSAGAIPGIGLLCPGHTIHQKKKNK